MNCMSLFGIGTPLYRLEQSKRHRRTVPPIRWIVLAEASSKAEIIILDHCCTDVARTKRRGERVDEDKADVVEDGGYVKPRKKRLRGSVANGIGNKWNTPCYTYSVTVEDLLCKGTSQKDAKEFVTFIDAAPAVRWSTMQRHNRKWAMGYSLLRWHSQRKVKNLLINRH
jgi:hypothetical protein